MTSLALALSRGLENGTFASLPSRVLSGLWETFADPVRPIALPRGARVIGVGGATLGGSGKTPFVLALARAVSLHARVAVVGHGYRAKLGAPMRVDPDADARSVGDEASWLARELAPLGVPVFVGSSREKTLRAAAECSDLIIADGLLQTRPERLALSLCVLAPERPWGAGLCPPAGDLRARRERLLAACDEIVMPKSVLSGAQTAEGRDVALSELRRLRVGVVLAIARPERILDALGRNGVAPAKLVLAADHAVPAAPAAAEVDVWLTTAKCATKLGSFGHPAPVWVLRHELLVPDAVLRRALGASM